jgi:arginyl-tRNA synthetase
MERYAKRAADALSQILNTPVEAQALETPPDPTMGDFGYPCFRLAKEFRKSPPQVAAGLVQDLESKKLVPHGMTVAAVGPYVNFTVPGREVVATLLGEILMGHGLGKYGSLAPETRGTWVLEFSSPNVAKPLNIYHLRATALGAVLDKVGRFRGYKLVSINHLGDWGKQYGMLTVAFRIFGKTLADNLSMMDLVDLYVKVNAEAEKNPAIQDEAREAFLKLEQGDPAITALWQKCVDISIKEFDRIYGRIGVKFDHIWGESHYKNLLQPLVSHLKERGIMIESEGAWVAPVTDKNGKELPPCILIKSDGATIYATRDVAAAVYRYEKFHFDRMTYIVGGEQRLHFEQVFAVLRKMGFPWVERCEHTPTGLYRFKDAKMSTRKGNFVTLEEVLELAKDRVKSLMLERIKRAEEAAKEAGTPVENAVAPTDEIAEAVAVGAVIFHDLHTDPSRDVEFDIDHVVDFEGETGPYLQYAHTRCVSILRKAKETGQFPQLRDGELFNARIAGLLMAPEEISLVKTLGQFPLQLERTLHHSKASALAHYLIDVTRAFGAFYRECRVLGEAPETTHARLMLVEATRRILARGMELLLIPLPERM